MRIEEFVMKEVAQNRSYKRMRLDFYMPSNTLKQIGGRRNIDFIYIDKMMVKKRMKKRQQRQRTEELIRRPLLQTLLGFIEASRCRTLEKFAGGEKQ